LFGKYWIRAGWPHTDCLNTIICCTRNHIPVVQSIGRHFPEWTLKSHTQNEQHMLVHYWLFSLDHCRLLPSDWYLGHFGSTFKILHKTDTFVCLTLEWPGRYLNFRTLFMKKSSICKRKYFEIKGILWTTEQRLCSMCLKCSHFPFLPKYMKLISRSVYIHSHMWT
jgi:hypothetical protein